MSLPIAIDDLLNGKTVEWERLELKGAEAADAFTTTIGERWISFTAEVIGEVVWAGARASAAYPLARPASRRYRPPQARPCDRGAVR